MTTLQKKPTVARPRPSGAPSSATRWLRPHVVGAVFWRNVVSYFSNPAGYVFITLFVFVSSWAAFWQPVFFASNLANLAPLNEWMPYLLLVFIPAITMTTWAEERKQGTDELLLTLPARDVEVVLGKYLAALGIYTVALLFSLSHVLILMWLGAPDLGVMVATYLGYWLMGAMFLALGMVASMLSTSATVAFILGAVFCAVPVFLHLLGSLFRGPTKRLIEDLSVPAQFRDFGTGVIPLVGVFYFLAVAAGLLYVNMVLLGRRHWAGGERSRGLWMHSAVRIAAVGVALASLVVLVGRGGVRLDVTAERLHELSPESRRLIAQIPAERPVFIQAYYSPEVPREYVQVKTDLINKLKEVASVGGDRIQLNLIETELYSEAAREARRQFGIEPLRVFTADEARQTSDEIYLGVAFTSGPEEVVIPFFDRGLPVEYELIRSIRVVSRADRKKVGILTTDARLLGGFDFSTMHPGTEWSIVTELRKQYEVASVSADTPIPTDLDVLLVAQPSSLTQPQIDTLTAYVRDGGPTLLLVDPLPADNPQLSPEEPRMPPGGPFGGSPPPEPKGDLRPLLDLLGIVWPTTQIVWNEYNPHPQLADLPPEVVFIGAGSGAEMPFNPAEAASSGLQEVVFLFPGLLRAQGGRGPEFIPLLRTSDHGGTLAWNQIMQRGFLGMYQPNPDRVHLRTGLPYTLAARVYGPPADAATARANPSEDEATADSQPEPAAIHAIVIADLDLISEQFFELRRRGIEYLDFDNITFVLNCVDVLADDEAFVSLRKRRPRHRTLTRIEALTRDFIDQRQAEERVAEDAAQEKLQEAQARLDEKVNQLETRTDLDERTKAIMLANLRNVEQRRLDVTKASIEDEKRLAIQESRATMERQVRGIENRIRFLAIALPPLPALLLASLVFGVRLSQENRGANPNRLA